MSGMYGFMRKLKWPLGDFEALKATHGCWDSDAIYHLSLAKRNGSSVYPPCVYTDDPNFAPTYGEGCERYGLCSFFFHDVLREFNLHELGDAPNPLFAKGDCVMFDHPSGPTLRGAVCQIDRRWGPERQYFNSFWTYDIFAEVYDSSGENEKGMCLFKHIPEWSVWRDDFSDDETESC